MLTQVNTKVNARLDLGQRSPLQLPRELVRELTERSVRGTGHVAAHASLSM